MSGRPRQASAEVKAELDSLLEEVGAGRAGPQRLWALEREAIARGDQQTRERIGRVLKGNLEVPSYSDPEYDAPDAAWWLICQWAPGHRHTAQDIHPLLLRLQQARGSAFLSTEHVVAVMDPANPEALVEAWIADAPAQSSQRQRCEWSDCRRRAIPGHLFCLRHSERALKRGLAIRGAMSQGRVKIPGWRS